MKYTANNFIGDMSSIVGIRDFSLKDWVEVGFGKSIDVPNKVWNLAKKVMDKAIELNLVYYKDIGQGKGKYWTKEGVDVNDVVRGLEKSGFNISILNEKLKRIIK